MPYLNKSRKDELDALIPNTKLSEGDLNYFVTKLLLNQKPERYADFNALVGVLESCKLEFYRRAVSPYEDLKVNENGDVY
jgi:hypothetical protein